MSAAENFDPDRQLPIFCQAKEADYPLAPTHRHTCRKFYRHTGDHRCPADSMRWIGEAP